MDPLDDIVKEFLIESLENLDRLDQDLLALEHVPDDRDRLSSVFRAIHTIKGTSGFLAFGKLEQITHVGESLLVQLRDGKMRLNSTIASGLLDLVDAVRKIMANIESGQGEGNEDYDEIVSTLERLQATGGVESPSAELPADAARRASEVLDSIAQQVEFMSGKDAVQTTEMETAVPTKRRRTSSNRRKKAGSNATGSSAAAVAELEPSIKSMPDAVVPKAVKPASSVRLKTAALRFISANPDEQSCHSSKCPCDSFSKTWERPGTSARNRCIRQRTFRNRSVIRPSESKWNFSTN